MKVKVILPDGTFVKFDGYPAIIPPFILSIFKNCPPFEIDNPIIAAFNTWDSFVLEDVNTT